MSTTPTTNPSAQWSDKVPQAQLATLVEMVPVIWTDEWSREWWTLQESDSPDGALVTVTSDFNL